MSEDTIKKLMNELSKLEYKSSSHDFYCSVVNKDDLYRVEGLIRKFLLDDYSNELGELKAKVYTYEKIIANSNFAPMIKVGD